MPDVVSSELSTGPGTLVEWKCSQILPVQAQSAGVTQGADRGLGPGETGLWAAVILSGGYQTFFSK